MTTEIDLTREQKKAIRENFKRVKDYLGMSNQDIADLAGFASAASFQSSRGNLRWKIFFIEVVFKTIESTEKKLALLETQKK